jgi:hypothetical protein
MFKREIEESFEEYRPRKERIERIHGIQWNGPTNYHKEPPAFLFHSYRKEFFV